LEGDFVVYNFDKAINRIKTNSIKWDYTKEFIGKKDLLPLWIADMDFEVPQEVKNIVLERANHGIYGYTKVPISLYESFIKWISKRHNWEIKLEWLIHTPGVVPGINYSINALTKEEDKIIIQTPVYSPFYSLIIENKRKVVNNMLILTKDKYKINFKSLVESIDETTKAIILCSPHNPVGRVWTREELMRIGQICIEKDLLIISDEIHSDIIYNGYKHIPIASLSKEIMDRTITFMAPSKTFNIAGLSSAIAIIPNEKLRDKYVNIMSKFQGDIINVFGVVAFEACYKYGEGWLEELIEYLSHNKDYVKEYIKYNLPKLKVIEPEGTYLLWLNFNNYNISHDKIKKILVEEAKVGLNDGITFGNEGEGYFRMNIGCPRQTLKEALDRIKKAFDNK